MVGEMFNVRNSPSEVNIWESSDDTMVKTPERIRIIPREVSPPRLTRQSAKNLAITQFHRGDSITYYENGEGDGVCATVDFMPSEGDLIRIIVCSTLITSYVKNIPEYIQWRRD